MTLAIILRTITILWSVVEYFGKVLKPTCIDNGAVRKDKGTGKVHLLDYLQAREGLSKTHLCVPKHLITLLKLLFGLIDGIALFWTENNRTVLGTYLCCRERHSTLLRSIDSILNSLQVRNKPLVGFILGVKNLLLNTRTLKHLMHLAIG